MKNSAAVVVVLGVLAGVGMGGGIGFRMGQKRTDVSTSDALEPNSALSIETAPSTNTPLVAGKNLDRIAAPVFTTKAEVVEADPAQTKALASAVEATVPKPELGVGTITGSVQDQAGVGLAGVVVRAHLNRTSGGIQAANKAPLGPPALEDLQQSMEESARKLLEQRANLRQVLTELDGSYALTGLPEGHWTIQAYIEHYNCEARAGRGNTIPTGAEFHFIAKNVQRVEVLVLDPDGTVPQEAVLEWTRGQSGQAFHASLIGSRPKQSLWSQKDSDLFLEPGTWSVRALGDVKTMGQHMLSQRASGLVSEIQVVSIDGAQGAERLTLHLGQRLGISGRVIVEDKRVALDNVTICMSSLDPGGTPDLIALAKARNDQTAMAMVHGAYTFQDLEPGTYVIGVRVGYNGAIIAHQVVDVGEGQAVADLIIPSLDPSEYLTVHAIDFAGDPVEITRYQYKYDSESLSKSGSVTGIPLHPSGVLLRFPESIVPRSEGDSLFLTANHNELGEKTVTVEPRQSEMTIVFAPPTSLVVELSGIAGGNFRARTRVSASKRAEGGGLGFSLDQGEIPDSRGSVQLDALEPGACTVEVHLQASADGNGFSRNLVASMNVDLRPGPNEVRLAIPPLYQVSIVAPEEEAGTMVTLMGMRDGKTAWQSGYRQGKLDSNGRALFADLGAGTFQISAGQSKAVADVPTGEVILSRKKKKADPGK